MSDELWSCPICGAVNGVHVDGVEVSNAHQSVVVEAQEEDSNAKVFTTLGAGVVGAGRRHDVSLLGWCEQGGHKFRVNYRQHKGDTFVSVTEVPGGVAGLSGSGPR